MKIALFSTDGYGMPIAYHLQCEGHQVYVGQVQNWADVGVKIKEDEKGRKKRLSLYDGLFDKKWPAPRLLSFLIGQSQQIRREFFVICDFNWHWQIADQLRKAGYRGLLPRQSDYQLEHDRVAAQELIEELYPEIDIAEHHEFKTAKDGIKFLEGQKERLWVLKGFNADAETMVPDTDDPAKNHEMLTDALENDKDRLYEKDGYMLSEKIVDVVEFTPEAIGFDGEVIGVNVDIEHKRLGSRNGPMVGCAAGLVLWQDDNAEIYEKFLEPLEKRMLRADELTIWDLSVLYSPERDIFFAGEFCPNRMGFDSVFAEISTFPSCTDWLESLMGSDNSKTREAVGVSLRVFNPEKEQGLFIGDPGDPNVWCYDLHRKDGKFYAQGLGKDAYVLTAAGKDIDTAIKALYKLEGVVEFNPGLSLQKHDLYDTKYPENILHRYEILKKLEL